MNRIGFSSLICFTCLTFGWISAINAGDQAKTDPLGIPSVPPDGSVAPIEPTIQQASQPPFTSKRSAPIDNRDARSSKPMTSVRDPQTKSGAKAPRVDPFVGEHKGLRVIDFETGVSCYALVTSPRIECLPRGRTAVPFDKQSRLQQPVVETVLNVLGMLRIKDTSEGVVCYQMRPGQLLSCVKIDDL